MTETQTAEVEETAGEEIKPFTDEQDREIAYRSDSNPATASGESIRQAIVAPGAATGRRKEAVVRVRMLPGNGEFKLNGRSLEDYFPNKVHQQLVKSPLVAVERPDVFDIQAKLVGGGPSGQAGAMRLAIARALVEVSPEDRPTLKKAGFLTRDARAVERKKYGLKKARKASQYSKR